MIVIKIISRETAKDAEFKISVEIDKRKASPNEKFVLTKQLVRVVASIIENLEKEARP